MGVLITPPKVLYYPRIAIQLCVRVHSKTRGESEQEQRMA